MGKRVDLTGENFGRLEVISLYGKDKTGKSLWECKCNCGNIIYVNTGSLNSGNTKSCGCLQKDAARNVGRQNTVHGESRIGSRLYNIWVKMRARCNNPNNKNYLNYGGRGITVCLEWEKDYISFKEWALNNGYNNTLTIDRIDNDKGYSPDNCRWATPKEQGNNRRTNRVIDFNGESKTLREWAYITGIKEATLWRRLHDGWSVPSALNTPVKQVGGADG